MYGALERYLSLIDNHSYYFQHLIPWHKQYFARYHVHYLDQIRLNVQLQQIRIFHT
jgi:hypothetical protein